MRHDNFIPTPRFVRIRSRGRLPHWQVDDAVYSITFRLKDSLPASVVKDLAAQRARLLSHADETERRRMDRLFAKQLDDHLDRGFGSCLLRRHGEIVARAMQFFDRSRYELHAWCVMPNHVHAAVHVLRGRDVPEIIHSWKSYTSHKIGRGSIWQREYFDRIVRTPDDYVDTLRYIRANPAKARLGAWPWVG